MTEKEKRKMKAYMKVYMKAIIFALCFIMFWISPDAQAAYNNDLVNWGMDRIVELNKDKTWVEVYLDFNSKNRNTPYTLCIENPDAGIRASIPNITNASLNDIDSKDKYIEIVTCSSVKKSLTIYRWNGKKPVVYASARLTSELAKLGTKNNCYAPGNYVGCESKGKGILTVKVAMVIQGDPCILDMNYKVSNGSIKFVSSHYAVVDRGVLIKGSQAGKAWNAYQYPNTNVNNKRVFVLKKGEKIRALKLKITQQYTFMQVKRMKNNQTGWIVFRTKNIDEGNRNFNPYK